MPTNKSTPGRAPTDAESARRDGPDRAAWRRFGPYLSERQWGTVREDTGHDGNSWAAFPHDHARSRAYRFGEDGIAGLSDDHARLCLALTLWNEADPILKERMFGLTNPEGNHGEDVKEYWFYLDATPTASHLQMLYKYPHAAYPYTDLVETNRHRTRTEPEYELLDTGVFDEDRYFDVVVEYAKASPEDICLQVTATNRGPDPAPLRLLPTLWFRNTWSGSRPTARPHLRAGAAGPDGRTVLAEHPELGTWVLTVEADAELLFCENETNTQRLFGEPNATPFPKDGINDHVIHGAATVNPEMVGTKVAVQHRFEVPPGQTAQVRLRLTKVGEPDDGAPPTATDDVLTATFDDVLAARRTEADAFYAPIAGPRASEQEALVLRQALAGMIWGLQYFGYDVATWMSERGDRPFIDRRGRNAHWPHMRAGHVLSMPDPWEYPWFAAWDLAFQAVPLALVDLEAAKEQIEVLLSDDYLHPNGQIPAYEWNFDDVNPPVHAWAAHVIYELGRVDHGVEDVAFLTRVFHRLMLNFTWWVNRKDASGNNIFEGGFLGLDNIGVFDRSAPLPTGGTLQQADATAWMATYAQVMAQIAAELARHDPEYAPLVQKFAEHYLWIAAEVYGTEIGPSLWDEQDGFFYDAVELPGGHRIPLKVRSLVGLLPLAASATVSARGLEALPDVEAHLAQFSADFAPHLPLLRGLRPPNQDGRRLLSLVEHGRLHRILAALLDEDEFLSPHGIRSLSRRHAAEPYVFHVGHERFSVGYVPGDSDSPMFGGNSNWRGPVWFPMNVMLLRGLFQLDTYYGDAVRVEYPTGSGVEMSLGEVTREISRRLVSVFLPDAEGHRPSNGRVAMWQREHWRDNVLFYEYFNGDDGAGIGASHQTGWTGLVALLIHLLGNDEFV